MAEASFSKPADTETWNYTQDIRQMMHGFGDSSEPLFESAKIIEDVVLQQMRAITRRACEIADRRASSKKNNINGEDFIFLLRKDKVKLQRLLKYLDMKELGGSVQKVMMSDVPQNSVESEELDNVKKKPFQTFLEQIDNTGELLQNSVTMDDIKRRRCIRADIATRSMDEMRYIKYCKARRVSFVNKNRLSKFTDWVGLDGDIILSKQAHTILSYLAYETVAQIIDLAFLVRQDQNKMHGDAIDRQRLYHVNPFTYKPYYHGKNVVTKPFTPSEINEALRRYWSPQLGMTGPFNRWSMRRSHLKFLSL